ncbi:hypothetical protein HK405_012510 [Cladochytrium tenue]|nr:hypothetical protein HK405_012510 [Cladochytrium tenue]
MASDIFNCTLFVSSTTSGTGASSPTLLASSVVLLNSDDIKPGLLALAGAALPLLSALLGLSSWAFRFTPCGPPSALGALFVLSTPISHSVSGIAAIRAATIPPTNAYAFLGALATCAFALSATDHYRRRIYIIAEDHRLLAVVVFVTLVTTLGHVGFLLYGLVALVSRTNPYDLTVFWPVAANSTLDSSSIVTYARFSRNLETAQFAFNLAAIAVLSPLAVWWTVVRLRSRTHNDDIPSAAAAAASDDFNGIAARHNTLRTYFLLLVLAVVVVAMAEPSATRPSPPPSTTPPAPSVSHLFRDTDRKIQNGLAIL